MRDVIDSATHIVDSELFVIESQVNWLEMLSPTKNTLRWRTFQESGYKEVLPLTYPEISSNFNSIRRRLNDLPYAEIDNSIISALMKEKKEEICLQMDLIEERDCEGFMSTSISLFGGARPHLLRTAYEIMRKVPHEHWDEEIVGAKELKDTAVKVGEEYKEAYPDFNFGVHIIEDLNSAMMVNHGELYLARDLEIPRSRMRALIAHEVEVHVITRHNGRHQPLRQLECGLAYYDSLQEGLATLSEYITGNLPAKRLRMLAARVIAVDMAIHDCSIKEIFERLYEEYNMDPHDAFDTAVRAKRGGGLTKDAVYLEGLCELLDILSTGEDITPLFMGKFALDQREMLYKLLRQGILKEPQILPSFLSGERGKQNLEQLRDIEITQLFHPRGAEQ